MICFQALLDYAINANWSSVAILYQKSFAAVLQLQVRDYKEALDSLSLVLAQNWEKSHQNMHF